MGKTDKAENRVKYSLEEKLEVLKIYMEGGVKKIKTNTVFISNGVKYKIGMWQQNLREDKAEGMLKNMSPEIREQMEA